MKPQFTPPICHPIRNHFTNALFYLVSADPTLEVNHQQLSQIVEACNQPMIYKLFVRRLQGKPYSEADAHDFITWAQQGWQEATHYVFLITGQEKNIVGAIDIKSSDLNSAEVGYWMNKHYRGLMTNALKALIQIAHHASYQELYAHIHEQNTKSMGVAKRAGFRYTQSFTINARPLTRFVKKL